MRRFLTYLGCLAAFWALGSASLMQARSVDVVPSVLNAAINDGQRVTLAGNTHPFARPQFDRGAAPQDLAMSRMLLLLKRSPEQESALTQFLGELQDTTSANYHRWLTPEQFGQQFGLADEDIQKVTSWLQSQGFQVNQVSKGKTVVEFSGTAGQVQSAFHTAIHKFAVNSVEHWANVADPQIPAALTPAVAGVTSLHNFGPKPQAAAVAEQFVATVNAGSPKPQFGSGGSQALAPADYATIYNINPLYQAGVNGSGTIIAVVGRTNINVQDVNNFRSIFGLVSNPPQIVVNGTNPGDLGGGEEMEAVLDTTWAGAVAPNAQVDLVVSASTNTTDGIFLSEQYIINNNLANVMTESFGDCEANYTQSSAATISSMAQQAAAQGITFVVSAGDSGSAGCDNFNAENAASGPVSVNVLASGPYTVAVGGTQFNDNANPNQYWSTSNGSGYGSAKSYVPEDVWNANCTGSQCASSNILAGGGGRSQFFSKPSWQAGVTGIPSDGARDLPDVALTAAGHDPYLLCISGSCSPSNSQIKFAGVYGTSAAAPSFAGIMALVNQKTGSRQGQANVTLYKLAGSESLASCNGSNTSGLPSSSCIFNDVTVGTNAVPGESGYNTASETYNAGTGYDLASGLGSVNAANLANGWSSTSTSTQPAPSGWTQTAGTLTQVSVGNDGTVWGINQSGQVYWLNPQSGAFQQSSVSLAQIAVGSSTAVWGLDGVGNVYRLNSGSQTWSAIPGQLAKIAVGYDGDVWGLDGSSRIWHFNSSTQSFTLLAGSLSQISVGTTGSVWGLNSSSQIYHFNPGTQSFVHVPGTLAQIAVGADGDAWGLDSSSQIWHFNSLSQSFNQIAGAAVRLAVGAGNSLWVLNVYGTIYKFNNSTQGWDSLPGQYAQISASATGTLWALDSSGQIWEWNHNAQASQVFHQVPGQLVQISASPDGNVWGVNIYQQIWRFNPLTQNWDQIPGNAVQVAIGFGGDAWAINSSSQIWHYTPATQSWNFIPGVLVQIAVGSDGSVWGLNIYNQIWHYNPSISQAWNQIPGFLTQISVGVDGTVWGVNGGAIYSFNKQTQTFTQAPGNFLSVSVGSAANVWGLQSDRRSCQYVPLSQSWLCSGGNVANIAAGFDGSVWVTNTFNQAWTLNPLTQVWSQAAGSYSQIAVGADAAVYALSPSGSIYTFR